MPRPAFDPSPEPYILLLIIGFVIGTFGHVVGSKILVATGLGLVYAGILILPLVNYLT